MKSRFPCSKSKAKGQEQSVTYVQSQQLRRQNDANFLVLVSLLLTLNFAPYFTIADKTILTPLQSPLSPHSMLINERFTKKLAMQEMQDKESNENIKVDFLVLH